jgi:hypothetical protein
MVRTCTIHWFLEKYRKTQSGINEKNPFYYWWIPLDHPIIRACEDNPGHTDWCEVAAKVALVNRMYSAQLGRGKWGKYEAEDKVTKALVESDIDVFMRKLSKVATLNHDNLPKVVECHDKLVEIIRKRLKQYAVSFSSKYLSFHFPHVVPIFDTKATTCARKILKADEIFKADSNFRGSGSYEKHCGRILRLMAILDEQKIEPDVKTIDYVLYSCEATP